MKKAYKGIYIGNDAIERAVMGAFEYCENDNFGNLAERYEKVPDDVRAQMFTSVCDRMADEEFYFDADEDETDIVNGIICDMHDFAIDELKFQLDEYEDNNTNN